MASANPRLRPVSDNPFGVLGGPWTQKASFEHCLALSSERSELYRVAARLLSAELRPHVAAIYAFVLGVGDARTVEALDSWENAVMRAFHGEAEHPILVALLETAERFEIPVTTFKDLLAARRMDLTIRRYPTFAALEQYCDKGANPLGRALVHLTGEHEPESLCAADDISTGLALAAKWRHVAGDFSKGRIYLPEEDLLRFGVSEADLTQRRATAEFRALMAFEVARARTFLLRGEPLCRHLPRPFRVQVELVWLSADAVLTSISRAGYDVLNRDVRPGALEWTEIGTRLAARRIQGLTRW